LIVVDLSSAALRVVFVAVAHVPKKDPEGNPSSSII